MENTLVMPPSISIIADLDLAGLKYEVVKVALELDLFNVISTGRCTLADIADATRCDPRGLTRILDALCPLGLLVKGPGTYALTPTADTFLVRGNAADCADAYLRWWRTRTDLTQMVRNGKAALDLTGPLAEEHWAAYTAPDLLNWRTLAEIARESWAEMGVTPRTRQRLMVLDIACGSGVKTFVLAQDNPAARIVAVDYTKVIAIAAQIADRMGVANQVTFLPGNLQSVELDPEEFHVIRFGAILYYMKPDHVRAALLTAYDALKPDGLVVLNGYFTDEGRSESELALLVAVQLFYSAPFSQVYSFSEYKEFLEATGFVDVTPHGEGLISARKPKRR